MVRKKNNCIDALYGKLMKSHTRRPEHGYERDTLKEKQNLL